MGRLFEETAHTACQKSLFDKLVDGRASAPQFAMVVLHLRTVPSSAARCFASADFASLCVLEASAASRPPMRAVLPPLSSAWSLRVFAPPCADACAVFRGCALRFAPCARHFSPSGLRCSQAHSRRSLPYWGLRTGLRFAGPVFRGCGALRAVPQFSMVVPHLRTALR